MNNKQEDIFGYIRKKVEKEMVGVYKAYDTVQSYKKENYIKSLEQQFEIFLKLANDFCLDTTQSKTIPMYFENLETQASWMVYTRAYWLGVTDADKERWE